jgi:hypothetical protein
MPFDLSERFIDEAEQLLGAALPESYRTAMKSENGGVVEFNDDDWELYPIADSSDRKRLVRSCNHIIKETKFYKDCEGFPENALAIAANGCGDQLIFLREGNSYSPIVFCWSHETGELDKAANDFAELKNPSP